MLGAHLPFACTEHISGAGLYETPYQDSKVQSSRVVWKKDPGMHRVSSYLKVQVCLGRCP